MSLPLGNREKDIAIITLRNPRKHNCLTLSDVNIIIKYLKSWKNTNLRALILTAEGKSFCSGFSLSELEKRQWKKNPITRLSDELENCDYPTICALNGSAYGGGVEIALSCDFRVGHKKMKIFVPPAKLGIHYEPTGLIRSINVLGVQLTRRLFLLNEEIKGEALLDVGFVDFLVGKGEDVFLEAQEKASLIIKGAPLAVDGMKKTIVEIIKSNSDSKIVRERIKNCFESSDHLEALNALRENRNPVFTGK